MIHALIDGAAPSNWRRPLRSKLVRRFLNAPTILGRPVESLLTVERSREDVTEANVITDRAGVSGEQRIRVSSPLRVSFGYHYDHHTFSRRTSNDPGVGLSRSAALWNDVSIGGFIVLCALTRTARHLPATAGPRIGQPTLAAGLSAETPLASLSRPSMDRSI